MNTKTLLTFVRNSGSLMLSWPAEAGLFSLYATTNLAASAMWLRATNELLFSNGDWVVPLPVGGNSQRLFRLQSP